MKIYWTNGGIKIQSEANKKEERFLWKIWELVKSSKIEFDEERRREVMEIAEAENIIVNSEDT